MELDGRICTFCNTFKTRDNFPFHKRAKGQMYPHCRECCKVKKKEHYDQNKEKILAKQREKRNTDEYREKSRKQSNRYRKNNPEKMLLIWARDKCKRRKIEFNLEESDLEYTGICPVLGLKLEIGGDNLNNSPTLDRINPFKGYVKGNVVVISHLANRIKNQATLEQLEKVYNYVKKYEHLFEDEE